MLKFKLLCKSLFTVVVLTSLFYACKKNQDQEAGTRTGVLSAYEGSNQSLQQLSDKLLTLDKTSHFSVEIPANGAINWDSTKVLYSLGDTCYKYVLPIQTNGSIKDVLVAYYNQQDELVKSQVVHSNEKDTIFMKRMFAVFEPAKRAAVLKTTTVAKAAADPNEDFTCSYNYTCDLYIPPFQTPACINYSQMYFKVTQFIANDMRTYQPIYNATTSMMAGSNYITVTGLNSVLTTFSVEATIRAAIENAITKMNNNPGTTIGCDEPILTVSPFRLSGLYFAGTSCSVIPPPTPAPVGPFEVERELGDSYDFNRDISTVDLERLILKFNGVSGANQNGNVTYLELHLAGVVDSVRYYTDLQGRSVERVVVLSNFQVLPVVYDPVNSLPHFPYTVTVDVIYYYDPWTTERRQFVINENFL